MKSRLLKTCSWVLVLAMLINTLPIQILALDTQSEIANNLETQISSTDATSPAVELSLADATILMEIEENRTEFTKEY